jgi:hypothetical protein
MERAMMPFEHLERVYDGLASAIDRAGAAGETLLLTRLALLLAERLGDIDAVEACIAAASNEETPAQGAAGMHPSAPTLPD